ncbi:tetratricopeptide repeat protein [Taibaiella helva]|uniref:tetratricopeptide repeat protein n=1 Tax=Taibaiella helva TaxID=2301235 RepID=UPI001300602D|nr:tetratricopeptide repeat protein [Taibaiella helva]
MPGLSHDYGQNGDENVEAQYGRDILNYYTRGDRQALDYDAKPHPQYGMHMQGMQFYGGMFNVLGEAVHRVFPGWDIMHIRHFFASIFGALLMIFTGLLAYRLSRRQWWVAVLTLVFMFFSPRIFGESMNNGKDIPFALGMVMCIYYLVRALQDLAVKSKFWPNTIGMLLGIFIIFGMRPAGGILIIAYYGLFILVYFLVSREKKAELLQNKYALLKRLALQLLIAFVAGYSLMLFTWPYGLTSPVSHLFTSLAEMSNRSIIIRTLYDGVYYPSNKTPWHYNFKWIILTSPVIVVVCCFLFVVLALKAIKMYGAPAVFILFFCALFPLLYIIYKHSTNFDSWRHVIFVYPFWVVTAALSVDILSSFLKGKARLVPVVVAVAGLLPVMVWTVKAHPNQYVYFNELEGGPKGAFGYYDLDYYQSSGKQSAQWILKNVKRPPAGQKIRVFSNMDGMDWYFARDTSWIATNYARYYERNQQDWDYYITYGRFVSEWQLQNGKWPPGNVVYSIEAGGVPIGVVIERKSKGDYYAYEALKVNDFAKAATLSEDYLKVDKTNEMVYLNYGIALASLGRLDEAVGAVKAAVALDPVRPDFYQVLAQIYKAKGDTQNADQAMMTAQSIMAQQQQEED